MKKRFIKKMMSFTLAGAMALTPVTAFASGTTEETGKTGKQTAESSAKLAGYISDTDVISVTLPTAADDAFAFKLDPQKLLYETAVAEEKAKVDSSFIFETPASATELTKSQSIEVVSKSNVAIDVTVSAKLTSDKIVATKDSTFDEDTDPSIYLAVCNGDTTVAVDSKTKEAKATVKLDALPEADFNITGDESHGFQIVADADKVEEHKKTTTFYLQGACNENGDWSEAEDETPTLTLTWSFAKSERKPAASYTLAYDNTATNEIVLDLGGGTLAATDVTAVAVGTTAFTKKTTAAQCTAAKMWCFDKTTKTLYISKANGTILKTGTEITVTFDTGDKATITIE